MVLFAVQTHIAHSIVLYRNKTILVGVSKGNFINLKRHVDCKTPHAIYVIECTRCGHQGVGETSDLRKRILSYIRAADIGQTDPSLSDRVIL